MPPTPTDAVGRSAPRRSTRSAKDDDLDGKSLASDWNAVLAQLEAALGAGDMNHWVRRLRPLREERGAIVLAAPDGFIRDQVLATYVDAILVAWRRLRPDIHRVDVVVSPGRSANAPVRMTSSGARPDPPASVVPNHSGRRRTFENFCPGPGRDVARRKGLDLAESEAAGGNRLSPLYVYGEVGCGKTHLRHAIVHRFRQHHPEQSVVNMTTDEFTQDLVHAMNAKTVDQFRETFFRADLFAIDNIQVLGGRPGSLNTFHQILDFMVESDRRIVVFGDRVPGELEGFDERVRERLASGVVARLEMPDAQLRYDILWSHVRESFDIHPHTVWQDEALRFLADQGSASCWALGGYVNRLLAEAELVGDPITRDFAEDRLRDLIARRTATVTVDVIRQRVAQHFGVSVPDLISVRRSREVVWPRQIAMYLCRQLTKDSLDRIGAKFGGRDHSTVAHAISRVLANRKADPKYDDELRTLERDLSRP